MLFFATISGNPFFCLKSGSQQTHAGEGRAYYISAAGDDQQRGSRTHPIRTIRQLNTIGIKAGDTVLFEGGSSFSGTLYIQTALAYNEFTAPVLITSYGNAQATISGGDSAAIIIFQSTLININNLKLYGSGRKNGNTQSGLLIRNSSHVHVDNLDISGFQKSGLQIASSEHIVITGVYAHENGYAGISVDGSDGVKESNRHILISHCVAENNPGDPSNLTNHSGNGIVVGNCRNVTIDYCTATNNGWDMPRIGNGPVGIWAYEADSVVIQHCLSYRNKTSAGAADGGGFDFDGGVTNSTIQYCLSYENQGAGYCIFQYLYASPWHDNVFRYNISVNDGQVSDAHAGVYVWNSSRDRNQFYNCLFYNNTITCSNGAAVSYSELSERKNFKFYNNIFCAGDTLVRGRRDNDQFVANDWWSDAGGFFPGHFSDFTPSAQPSRQEILKSRITDLNNDPKFINTGTYGITNATMLSSMNYYALPQNSPLRSGALDLQEQFGIQTGGLDFNQHPAPVNGFGASF